TFTASTGDAALRGVSGGESTDATPASGGEPRVAQRDHAGRVARVVRENSADREDRRAVKSGNLCELLTSVWEARSADRFAIVPGASWPSNASAEISLAAVCALA